MKVVRTELLHQLESVQAGLSPREIIEQSSCFVFKDGKVLTYNDELAGQHSCSLAIQGAVHAESLLNVLRKMPEDELEVELTNGEIVLIGKRRRAGISMQEEILLSVENVEKPGKWVKLHPAFSEAVDTVQSCASGKNEEKFTTTCIHVHPKWIEAFDNYQLARYTLDTGISKATLVRRDTLKHIVNLGMTKFSETENWIHFKNADGLILSCKHSRDEFQDLTPFIEADKGKKIALPKGIGEVVERCEIFSVSNPDDDKQIEVTIKPEWLRIKGTGGHGWFQEKKKIAYNGPSMSFKIAPKLLVDLATKVGECRVSTNLMRVDAGSYVYVTSLASVVDDADNVAETKAGKKSKKSSAEPAEDEVPF